jgi:hypothetical protein
VEASRAARLGRRANRKRNLFRKPSLDYSQESKTTLLFIGLSAGLASSYFSLTKLGIIDIGSKWGLILAFTLGFAVTCALASTLAFLVFLRHELLLLVFSAALTAAGAILVGWEPLEGLAKLIFATSAGLLIGLMLTSISQVLLVSGLIIVVDFYSVFLGPTKKMVESGSRWIDYFTINLPVFGAPADSKLGVSDLIFFAIFTACTLTYRLRRATTALAMTASFVGTMIIGVSLDTGVPALPLLSLSFVLANADLLYKRFLEEPDEQRKRGKI